LYGGDAKITAIREIYEIFISVYFVSERQITQPLTVITEKAVTEIKVQLYLLFSDEIDNDPYAAPLPAENRDQAPLTKVYF
jgi:hypothetical protein